MPQVATTVKWSCDDGAVGRSGPSFAAAFT
jgi:hypothetical protein